MDRINEYSLASLSDTYACSRPLAGLVYYWICILLLVITLHDTLLLLLLLLLHDTARLIYWCALQSGTERGVSL
jgi:hypothetical protein